jgi:transposase
MNWAKVGAACLKPYSAERRDAEVLAELARGRLRAKLPALRKALDGRVQPHHRTLLVRILAHIDFLEESLAQLQMEPYLVPFEEAMELVQSIVGIGEIAAASIIAEIGADMTRFASDKHIARLRRGVPRQEAERRQAAERQNDERQPLSAGDLV